jgi:type IV secretory pathway VirB4 component
MTRTILANWHTLQELSGVKAEIPEKLKRELNYKFEKDKAKEIEELKKHYEKQLSDLETNQLDEVRQQLKDKLVSLAKMARKTEN